MLQPASASLAASSAASGGEITSAPVSLAASIAASSASFLSEPVSALPSIRAASGWPASLEDAPSSITGTSIGDPHPKATTKQYEKTRAVLRMSGGTRKEQATSPQKALARIR